MHELGARGPGARCIAPLHAVGLFSTSGASSGRFRRRTVLAAAWCWRDTWHAALPADFFAAEPMSWELFLKDATPHLQDACNSVGSQFSLLRVFFEGGKKGKMRFRA